MFYKYGFQRLGWAVEARNKFSHYPTFFCPFCSNLAMATGDCNKEFSTDYILLEPEKLNFYELIRILFPGDIEKRKFVDCLEGAESNFERRWIIFISISAQKFLQFVAKPLSWFGSAFETGLNLSSTNGGFGMLLLNCLRGQWFHYWTPWSGLIYFFLLLSNSLIMLRHIYHLVLYIGHVASVTGKYYYMEFLFVIDLKPCDQLGLFKIITLLYSSDFLVFPQELHSYSKFQAYPRTRRLINFDIKWSF